MRRPASGGTAQVNGRQAPWPPCPICLAHDHMNRPEDLARDLAGGVAGKILCLFRDVLPE